MTKPLAGPTVVLVGRPNVGKSTLFNRITGSRRSIVAPIAGTTRDVIHQPAEWQGRHFVLADTGGLFGATTDPLHEMVVSHGLRWLKSADLIVMVVDGREGLMTGDQEIARRIRKMDCPVILAVNKTDDKQARAQAAEFHRLGIETQVEIAAEHGEGVADLLDAVNAALATIGVSKADAEADLEAPHETAVAIVGRPNVGKSSLVNRLLREERMMVSDMPGTTRDAVDVVLTWHKKRFRIVDTAGMRKPGKVASSGQIEAVSVLLAKRAMMRAEVAVLVVDANEGVTDRDAAIAGEAQELGLGLIIAINKWDLTKGRGDEWVKRFDDTVRFRLKFLDYVPLIHISAMTGDRTSRVLETIDRIAAARKRKIGTGELNRFLEEVTSAHAPVSKGKKDVRIMYGTQTATEPPEFILFTNVATELHFSYERFLANQLRERFGFEGTPIRLKVRRRARKGRED